MKDEGEGPGVAWGKKAALRVPCCVLLLLLPDQ